MDWEQEISGIKTDDLLALQAALSVVNNWEPFRQHLGSCSDCVRMMCVLVNHEVIKRDAPQKQATTFGVSGAALDKLKEVANKRIR